LISFCFEFINFEKITFFTLIAPTLQLQYGLELHKVMNRHIFQSTTQQNYEGKPVSLHPNAMNKCIASFMIMVQS